MQNAILSLLTTPNATKGVRDAPVSTPTSGDGFALIVQADTDAATQSGPLLVDGVGLPQTGFLIDAAPQDLSIRPQDIDVPSEAETAILGTEEDTQNEVLTQDTATPLAQISAEETAMRLGLFGVEKVVESSGNTGRTQPAPPPVYAALNGQTANADAPVSASQMAVPRPLEGHVQTQILPGQANVPLHIDAAVSAMAEPAKTDAKPVQAPAQPLLGWTENGDVQTEAQSTRLPKPENVAPTATAELTGGKPTQELALIPAGIPTRQAAANPQMTNPNIGFEAKETRGNSQPKQGIPQAEAAGDRKASKTSPMPAGDMEKLGKPQTQPMAGPPQNTLNPNNTPGTNLVDATGIPSAIPIEKSTRPVAMEKPETPNSDAYSRKETSAVDRSSVETSGPLKLEMSPQNGQEKFGAAASPLSVSGSEISQLTGLTNAPLSTDNFSLSTLTAKQEPALARHVAAQVADIAQPLPNRPVDMTLSPEELGKVRLTFTTENGALAVSITAERPETLDLMRRHIETLAQELRTIGYRDISFGFSQSGENTGSQTPGEFGDAKSATAPDEAADLTQPEQALAQIVPNRDPGAGIDIRI